MKVLRPSAAFIASAPLKSNHVFVSVSADCCEQQERLWRFVPTRFCYDNPPSPETLNIFCRYENVHKGGCLFAHLLKHGFIHSCVGLSRFIQTSAGLYRRCDLCPLSSSPLFAHWRRCTAGAPGGNSWLTVIARSADRGGLSESEHREREQGGGGGAGGRKEGGDPESQRVRLREGEAWGGRGGCSYGDPRVKDQLPPGQACFHLSYFTLKKLYWSKTCIDLSISLMSDSVSLNWVSAVLAASVWAATSSWVCQGVALTHVSLYEEQRWSLMIKDQTCSWKS